MQNNLVQNFLRGEHSRFSAWLFLAATFAVLAGCGSGGSGGTPTKTGTAGAGSTAGSLTTPSTATTTATPVPTLTIALTNAAGTTITSITSGVSGTVKATLKDATGAVVPNSVVTFTVADTTLATMTPAAGTALTDATGVATITLNAVGLASGATTINASAQVGTPPTAVTGTLGFAVGASAVTVSAPVLGVGAAPLSAFGTTSLTVTVSSGGTPVTAPQNVTFSSSCASSGKAVLSTAVATVNGVATGSYRDNGCAGTDTITATAAGVTSAATSLVITPPTVGSIQFVSATPSSISLAGTGGVSTSQVIFKVVDTGGNPLSGQTVTFALSTAVGGITLTPASGTATSDANGQVVTTVNSGKVSTPVRVTASTPGAGAGTTLSTQSNGLTITTGIPTQNGFSLAATKLNLEAWEVDGNTTVLTVFLNDHFGNPVPDGTVVNFTSDGGTIIGTCSTTNSTCNVTMTGTNPRPPNGRVVVLAYAIGEESFIDLNGNGVADLLPTNEMVINGISTAMPEAFLDANENGVRDPGETFIDFNGNGKYDVADPTVYHGVLCDSVDAPPVGSNPASMCSPIKSIDVFKNLTVVFSGSHAYISQISPAGTIDLGGCTTPGKTYEVDLRVVDVNGNPLPVGTTIAVTTSDGTMTGISNFTEANTNVTPAVGAATHPVFIKNDVVVTAGPPATCTDPTPSGFLTVTVTTPGGVNSPVTTTQTFTVNN